MKIFNLHINHHKLYYISLLLVAASLPLSKFAVSVSMITLATNWVLEGHFAEKMKKLRDNPSILIFCGIFLVHLLWLLNTSNFQYALHDLKNKLILIVFPIIVGTSPTLKKSQFKFLLLLFSLSVFISTLISTSVLLGIIDYPINDIRDISMFFSHIRLSLLINVSIFSLAYFLFSNNFNKTRFEFIAYSLTILWLVFFLFILKSLTGIIIFFILFFLLAGYYSFRIKELVLRLFVQVLMVTIFLLIATFLTHAISKFYAVEKVDFENLEQFTASGNPYQHNTKLKQIENGNYVWLYVCPQELKKEWNRISEIAYNGKDKKGQQIKTTLIRYLTSKGFRKDSVGISKLTSVDIMNIENGVANYIFTQRYALYPKVYQIIWEIDVYRKGANPTGNSITQRWEFLKTASSIIQNNFWFGTGTGDVQDAFNAQYEMDKSLLPPGKRLRTHNQYVTFFVSFGIVGFLIVIFCMFFPPIKRKGFRNYLFVVFFLIAMFSMLNEDTLENQIGVTFFSYFYALFLFGNRFKLKENDE
ncbi:MAG: O-antigen ligase family protein [Bacteroidota bacterium]|nr:O-antigen ligase family protein [Bacteroidota bacterium]